jgi:flavin-binding protein dodecin
VGCRSSKRSSKEDVVAGNTYRVTEIVGSSANSVDDAIKSAISRAAQTLRGLDWFEVTEIRGHIEDGAVGHIQVGLKVGFRLEES